uniref:Uncharacterized protein n=1 Tax=Arundo donax TaxID=35708 RepID=A0A0A9A8P5_ARUDO
MERAIDVSCVKRKVSKLYSLNREITC